ncbi:hypothetical protein [Rhodopirellula sp. MGV]|uniref:hypothetical protein n=1 Tax=Rhodopirellula sp. MGV TaxID=2023130 RepID=UPI000B972138|nr:hypothetical protein [Rhodopirellula sp. MGV]OYP34948.1 hypothetical protein CGZ80_13070 [Rhodopirellula sp. MGV]PNY38156.1 hypothetical protein C2E31_03880 [Rhodopirellula baltica]
MSQSSNPLSTFHIHVYGPVAEGIADETLSGRQLPIPTTFEAAMDRLEQLSALTEPDGSIAWSGPDHQLVGMIYDAAGQIQYLELRGHGSPTHWRTLIQSISGFAKIDRFSIMILPLRQWKNFQSFESLLSG